MTSTRAQVADTPRRPTGRRRGDDTLAQIRRGRRQGGEASSMAGTPRISMEATRTALGSRQDEQEGVQGRSVFSVDRFTPAVEGRAISMQPGHASSSFGRTSTETELRRFAPSERQQRSVPTSTLIEPSECKQRTEPSKATSEETSRPTVSNAMIAKGPGERMAARCHRRETIASRK